MIASFVKNSQVPVKIQLVYRGYYMLLCHIERVSVDNARTAKQ